MNRALRILTGLGLVVGSAVGIYWHFNQKPPVPEMPRAQAQEPKTPVEANKGDHTMFGGTPSRNMIKVGRPVTP